MSAKNDYEDFSDDESDSEAEYSEGVKQELNKARYKHTNEAGSEDELYAFSDSDSDSDDIKNADSDIEGAEDDDLPDSRAWGKRKGTYYSTDYIDQDYGGFNDEREEKIAEQEEIEARALQARLTKELDVLGDFSLDILDKKQDAEVDEEKTIIKTDVSNLSKRQKQQLFLKESPEFSGLVVDFKNKMEQLQKYLVPIKKLYDSGTIESSRAVDFIICQYNLILNYCNNILFYLLLKSKRIIVENHPVVKRLYQYRQLLVQLDPIFKDIMQSQIEDILQKYNTTENESDNKIIKKDKKSKKKLGILNNIVAKKPEKRALEEQSTLIDDLKSEQIKPNKKIKLKNSSSESEGEEEEDSSNNVPLKEQDGKRAITYQIAKNKGLIPKRKKEMRNPRVKHRNKFRKAKISRKGAVREVRTETTRYGGELSGIKASVKKSIKIK